MPKISEPVYPVNTEIHTLLCLKPSKFGQKWEKLQNNLLGASWNTSKYTVRPSNSWKAEITNKCIATPTYRLLVS